MVIPSVAAGNVKSTSGTVAGTGSTTGNTYSGSSTSSNSSNLSPSGSGGSGASSAASSSQNIVTPYDVIGKGGVTTLSKAREVIASGQGETISRLPLDGSPSTNIKPLPQGTILPALKQETQPNSGTVKRIALSSAQEFNQSTQNTTITPISKQNTATTYKKATTQEKIGIRTAQAKEPLKSFTAGFLFQNPTNAGVRDTGVNRLFYTGGLVTAIATPFDEASPLIKFGGKAKTGAQKGLQYAGRVLEPAGQAARQYGGQAIRLGRDLVIQGGIAYGAITGTRQAARLTTNEQTRQYTESYSEAIAAERDALYNDGGVNIPLINKPISPRALASELSLVFSNKKEVFKDTIRNKALEQGATKEQAEAQVKAALRERKIFEITEAALLLNIGRASERIGRRELTNTLERQASQQIAADKSFWKLFRVTAPPIARAGAVEGSTSVLIQQESRAQQTNPKEYALGGVFGAASAGIIGGTIGGTSISRPRLSKTTEFISNIVDPFEKPGDLLADAQEAALRKINVKVPTPAISVTLDKPSKTITFGTITNTPVNTKINVPSKTQVPSQKGNVQVITNTPANVPLPVKPNIPVKSNVPIPVQPNVPIPVQPNVPINIPANVPINTPANVPVNVNIPVVTPQLRVPPPLPLSFNIGGAGLGYQTKRRKGYVNELNASIKAFDSLLQGRSIFAKPKAAKRPKLSKKEKKAVNKYVKLQQKQGYSLRKLIFG